MATRIVGGVLVDDNGVLQCATSGSIAGNAAGFSAWPTKSDGSVLVVAEASQARTIVNGFALDNSNGFLIVDTSTSSGGFAGGFPISSTGALLCDSAGSRVGFVQGVAVTSAKTQVTGLLGPNLLSDPNLIGGGAWTPFNITAATNSATDPLGGSAATKFTFTGAGSPLGAGSFTLCLQSATVSAGTYQLSCWFKADAPATIFICTTPDGVSFTRQGFSVTTSWTRFSYNQALSGTFNFEVGYDGRDASQAGTTVCSNFGYGWGAALQLVS